MKDKTIIVTGGAGYIGSHACLLLAQQGYDVTVIDNLSNGHLAAIRRVETLAQCKIDFHHIDLCDSDQVKALFMQKKPHSVIHFAGLKSVRASLKQSLEYYHNNLVGTLNLLQAMKSAESKRLIFSSSATVYGTSQPPVSEDAPLTAINPYGTTKLMIENILQDLKQSDNTWQIAILRYFNPIGAHESGDIGEHPADRPENILPYIVNVAHGTLKELSVFGDDYDTVDGTGVRDYIHVMDLVEGHLQALEHVDATNDQTLIYNLGTGRGQSVLELIKTFERVSGQSVPYKIAPRRSGDVASSYASVDKANQQLKWTAKRTIEQACQDAWRWRVQNPQGYNNSAD